MTIPNPARWLDGALRSPATGHALVADTPHSVAAGTERWPVIEGIPFLRADRRQLADAVLHALDAGDADTGLVLLLGDQDGWARTPPPTDVARRALVRGADHLTFREAMDALAFGPVGTYFAHRWSDPTYLSGLALAEAHWTQPRQVFELACGAGHFLRAFGRLAPAAGGDLVFAKLWLARRYVAPDARLVCFDAASPWPLADGFADLVFCHDALYFLPEKPHVAREMLRVAGPHGRVLVGHTHNALVDNLSSGAPLAPAAYASLFGGAALYDDREMTAALIGARAPRAASAEDLADAPAICLAVHAGPARPVLAGLAMPADGAALRRNPLYVDGSVHWPSERYQREYAALATYPERSGAPDTAVAGHDPALAASVRRRELLELPERW